MIFPVAETRQNQKLTRHAIYTMELATSELLAWSDETVMFSVNEQSKNIPHPSRHALVVDPIVRGWRHPRVLMDGASGLNIIFPDTLYKMEISLSTLQKSDAGLHGFMPDRHICPLEQIEFEVVFEDEDNFQIERL